MGGFTILRRLCRSRPLEAGAVAQCVIAIPVRNEANGVVRCLDALDRMSGRGDALHEVLLVLNGCTDATWQTVQAWSRSHDLPLRMVEVALAPEDNHAGGARAAALRLALDALEGHPGGVVLTTDADTRVPHDWLERALAGIEAGCDVIAGDVDVEAASLTLWPASLRRRVLLEDHYAQLLDEVDALCDPVPHNPWPTHRRCSGANLVFRASALGMLPRLPSPSCGEDRALVAACLARDFRVRHDPAFRVETSARLRGRAPGGMADTLRWRTARPDVPCDPLLEPFLAHLRRATMRAKVRHLFLKGMPDRRLAEPVGLTLPGSASWPCHFFGEAWQRLEQLSPTLHRHPISPGDLVREIGLARSWLAAHHARVPHEGVAA